MAGFVPVTIAGRAFRKGPTSESGLVFCLLRFAGGFQWQTLEQSLPLESAGLLRAPPQARHWGRVVVKMAELLMNSAIPSEGSMQTSWPALRNNCCAPL